MEYFVEPESIVRKIWGKADTILFIFAGAAAEFALNKAVDWLYFTGRLPADPIGRLFSTVSYARQIIFSEKAKAHAAIDKMRAIHSGVEAARGAQIPDWAYRDVLFMLIHYSITSFEVLERKLSDDEKEEVVRIFLKVGNRMGIKDLPDNFSSWSVMYNHHLEHDLQKSHYTVDLFKQYRKHLGSIRYLILLEGQKLVVPGKVHELLHFRKFSFLTPILYAYKLARVFKAEWLLKSIVLPEKYKAQIKSLDYSKNA